MLCRAPAVATVGRCLDHVDDDGFRRTLAQAGPSRPLDLRGKTVDGAFLARLLALAPRDAAGRPVLRCASFGGATFVGPVSFAGVVFHDDVSFDRTVFRGDALFEDAIFEGHARFGLSTFEGGAGFTRARFGAHAWFSGTTFARIADFEQAAWAGPAWFGSADFATDVSFAGASFGVDANFDQARFGCHTTFASALFEGQFSIVGTAFAHEPRYDAARFKGPGGAPKAATRHVLWAGAPLASWSRRMAAGLLDLAGPVALVTAAVVLGLLMRSLSYQGMVAPLVVVALLAGAVLTVRNLIYQGHTGQTLGKRRLGLSVVRKSDGLPVGVRTSLLRAGLHVLDTVPLLAGWLAPLWSGARQTFADRIVATVVVEQTGWAGAAPTREKVDLASGFS